MLSSEGKFLWTNDAAAALLGFPREELMQMALPFGVGASGTVAAGPLAVGFRAVCFEGAPQAEGTARFRTKEDGRVSVYWTIWSIGREIAKRRLCFRSGKLAI